MRNGLIAFPMPCSTYPFFFYLSFPYHSLAYYSLTHSLTRSLARSRAQRLLRALYFNRLVVSIALAAVKMTADAVAE